MSQRLGSYPPRFAAATLGLLAGFSGLCTPLHAQNTDQLQNAVPDRQRAVPVPVENLQQAAPPAAAQQPVPAKLPKPSPQDSVVSRLIAQLMPSEHVSGKDLDNTLSARALDLYIQTLDPLKLYFLQSDIDQFERYSTVVDDHVRAGNLDLAYYIFERFTQRVDQRVAKIRELLKGDFDFNIDEQVIIDRDAAQYARDDAEATDRWRRQLKLSLLDLKDSDEPVVGQEARDQLMRRYDRYANRWRSTSSDDILEMFLTSVTNSYDPHSTYMSPATLDDFNISMALNLDGIGASLGEKDGTTQVKAIIPGGAADLNGKLKPDDSIVSVGQGDDGEMVDIIEMPLKDVVKLIRGKAGTTVRLGVRPGGTGNMEIVKIVRAHIELKDSAARGKVIEHEIPGQPGKLKIGYLNLPSFYMDMEGARRNDPEYRSSTRDVAKILEDFKKENVAGVVLDLSRNGGGSLTEAISLTGLFIDQGPVVQVKDANGSVQKYDDDHPGTVWDGPLVVLTSKLSASASEILAGAIKDYHRGIIVGDPQTHGKGTVQTLMDIGQSLFRIRRANYGALKVTLQQFYLPDGQSTQLDGVAADIVLPSVISKMPVAEGDLDYALAHDRINPAKHDLYRMAPADLINSLRASSQQRIAQDEEFIELMRRIGLYVEQKDLKTISLNEDKFMQRRAEMKAQKDEQEKEIEAQIGSEEVFHDTFYNQEVLNITQQYIEGLRAQNLARAN
ncbi:carboxy terminal-processing peptidase [Allorhodopirellula heiligendammensis]|uniref:Tail-specific protease n=1 Tax=Allorhodopirellula heiligendammensis TaxID=2714739 RepID=A0A5C6C2Q6_9BACT|nr:carboxy terminal-processing peptidase [Allorhodopirellula heiligendammensis]TWU18408.1 Tail-specific protease precursor [Allorhodopirellula heiligendammensis]